MAFASASLLQFDELKDLIAAYAGSQAGKVLVQELEPGMERFALTAALRETSEALEYLREASGPQATSRGASIRLRFDQVRSIESHLRTLRVEGARLEGQQLLDVFHNLDIAGEYKGILAGASQRYPELARLGNRLSDLRELGRKYGRVFLPDGSLTDDASPALARIRRDIARQQKTIQQSLERFIRSHQSDGTLQEDFVTLREDRFVVPIVAGQQGRVDGIVHGSSSSGRTLFIEPLETIGLNNQLVQLRENELYEIERILAEITEALREHAEPIAITIQTLAKLDFLFAKAGFGLDFQAVIPKLNDESAPRRLWLEKARHPLLEALLRKTRKITVPISFETNDEQRCLLISGPNTGGKTVTLKTAGLLSLMALSGLPVPAERAEIPFFDDVLADIGDTQSIAESLSSFSGHLLHVKQMLEEVTVDTLVLLDELGRATDPEEGGALGVAVLDSFRQTGCFTLASTHLLPLKLYGARTPNVLNASMGFNEETLQPTYQLRVGLPGKSAGLDIATRLALPAEIIAHARSVLPKLEVDFQDLLAQLYRQREENERQARELEIALDAARVSKQATEQEAAKLEDRRQRDWERATERLTQQFEDRAQSALDRLAEVAEQRKAAEQAARLIAKTKREFRDDAAEIAPTSTTKRGALQQAHVLREGAAVRLRDISSPATIRRILKNGALEVEAGFLKMQVSPDDIVEVLAEGKQSTLPKNVTFNPGPRWDVTYRELNIIGQRAEEATEQVERFLDSAALASVDRVRIVHGHGMGILKRAVHDLLSRSPYVSRSYPAPPAEGGNGATIVELRD